MEYLIEKYFKPKMWILSIAVLYIGISVSIFDTNSFASAQSSLDTNNNIAFDENQTSNAGDIIKDSWIVTFKENFTDSEDSAIESEISSVSDTLEKQGVNVTSVFPEIGVLVLNTSSVDTRGDAVESLNEVLDNDNILSVEPNTIVELKGQTIPKGLDRIDAEPQKSKNSAASVNATIAIIDSGIYKHPDLNVIEEVTFVPNTSNADDRVGHGTHVAGTAAAKDDSFGVVGVAPGSKLIAVKVFDGRTAPKDQILAGINWVADNADKIDVANLSFGGSPSVAEEIAVKRAIQNGVVIVAAAGNDNIDASLESPAGIPEVITVSAIADTDGKCGSNGQAFHGESDESFASFSNYGEVVDIAAPGVGVNSTVPRGGFNGNYDGTSMAAPHVTGAAALYKSMHPNATPEQVAEGLQSLASIPPTTVCIENSGKGYIIDRSFDNDNEAEPMLYVKSLVDDYNMQK